MQGPEVLNTIHMLSAIISPCLKFYFAILASLCGDGLVGGEGGL